MRITIGFGALCGLAIGIAGSHAANAATLKPGLWNFTTSMAGFTMPQLPPDVVARMKAAGVSIPSGGNTISAQRCISPEQAAAATPPITRSESGCTAQSVNHSGNQVTYVMACTGSMQGTASVTMNFTPDHFAGDYQFTGSRNGQAVDAKTHFEGQYLSDTCPAQ